MNRVSIRLENKVKSRTIDKNGNTKAANACRRSFLCSIIVILVVTKVILAELRHMFKPCRFRAGYDFDYLVEIIGKGVELGIAGAYGMVLPV